MRPETDGHESDHKKILFEQLITAKGQMEFAF
jgi:hypothetical protein